MAIEDLPLKDPSRPARLPRPPVPVCQCHGVEMYCRRSYLLETFGRVQHWYCPVKGCSESDKRVVSE